MGIKEKDIDQDKMKNTCNFIKKNHHQIWSKKLVCLIWNWWLENGLCSSTQFSYYQKPRRNLYNSVLKDQILTLSGNSSLIGFNLHLDPTLVMAQWICETISRVSPVSLQNLDQLSSQPSLAASRTYEMTVCSLMGPEFRGISWNI